MAKFAITFNVECNTPQEATRLKSAHQTIATYLPAADLLWVASQIRANPKIIQKVKALANNPLLQKLF